MDDRRKHDPCTFSRDDASWSTTSIFRHYNGNRGLVPKFPSDIEYSVSHTLSLLGSHLIQ
jgi:hypothetical protein